MARRLVVEATADERITAEQVAQRTRINENVGDGQRARIADNTARRWLR
ncbi:hypothetical protein [Actinospica robiniae]|nr:hypothetical protein [Actinospica robiniae]